MDLSKLSNEDLIAIQKGDMSKVSDNGLRALSGRKVDTSPIKLDAPPSAAESVLIGAGKAMSDIGSGIRQMLPGDNSALEQQKANEAETYAKLQQQHPIATAVGETLPYAAVPASLGVVPAAATIGAVEAIKYGSPQERLSRGLLSAGTTAAGGMAANKLASMIAPSTGVPASSTELLNRAGDIGVKPRLSQITGSKYAAMLEDFASRTPGGAGVMSEFNRANQEAFNRVGAKSFGEQANELSPFVFSNARSRLGKVFEDVKSIPGRPIEIGQNVGSVADDIIRQQSKMIPSQQDAQLVKLAQDAKAMAANRGRIDGEQYQLLRSGLSEESFNASGTNRNHYGQLLEALDDSAQQSLKKSGYDKLASDLKSARPQYSNLSTIEKGLVAEGGNLSPSRLAQALRSRNPAAFREGKLNDQDLLTIAQYGENFKPLREGSQTYERGVVSSMPETLIKAPFAYLAAKATTSPAALAYPRYVGGTRAAAGMAELANPVTRTMLSEALRRYAVGAPVAAENY